MTDRAEQTEVVHACPPDGKAVTPCCGRSPFELLRSDRMTADPGLVTCAARAEQAQPSGYTPPPVGAPTWSHAYGATIVELGDRLEIEWPNGRGMSWVAPKVIEGWVEQVNELRADRDRLRGVIAAAYVDLLAGRVDEAAGTLRAAGGQP